MKNKKLLVSLILGLLIASIQSIYAEPVEVGFGKLKVNGLLQFWYQNQTNATPSDYFRMRRAEIKLSGEIKPEITWVLMFDPAQVREDDITKSGANITSVGRKSILQDFLVSYKPFSCCSIDLGQAKVPFGMEGLESSAKIDFIERSMLASQLKWADYRDIGITIKSNFKAGSIDIQPAIGLYNGEGQNKLDANDPMDFVGRLVLKPISALHVGLAVYNGKTGATEVENLRNGIEVKYANDPVLIYAESVSGKSGGIAKGTYYVAATYKLSSIYQLALKYDSCDPDINVQNNIVTETTIGLNYFIEKHNSKLQLNYVAVGEETTAVSNDIIRLNFQVSY